MGFVRLVARVPSDLTLAFSGSAQGDTRLKAVHYQDKFAGFGDCYTEPDTLIKDLKSSSSDPNALLGINPCVYAHELPGTGITW